jgi:Nitrate reductase delta subunit
MTGTREPGLAATATSELVRALGAIVLSPPPSADVLCDAAGLPRISRADHTAAFVLAAPPFAAIHLGAEGKLGGQALDRVEGFWRALGLRPAPGFRQAPGQRPPEQADHLGVLLMSYAGLSEAAAGVPAAARATASLFHEHIWSFAPGYLTAVATLGDNPATAWAELTLRVLRAERETLPSPAGRLTLPLALREAPAALAVTADFDAVLDAAVTPACSGIILTQAELAAGAAELGLGYRRGERRYALRAMIEQDKASTLSWLAGLAGRWAARHVTAYGDTETGRWWSRRAAGSSLVFASMAREVS